MFKPNFLINYSRVAWQTPTARSFHKLENCNVTCGEDSSRNYLTAEWHRRKGVRDAIDPITMITWWHVTNAMVGGILSVPEYRPLLVKDPGFVEPAGNAENP